MSSETYPVLTPDIETVLEERYGQDLPDVGIIESNEQLIERIKQEAKKLGKNILNQIPSQFEHQDPEAIQAIPQYQFPVWKTLSENFDFFGIKGGVLWLQPAAWQYAYAFHHICRHHKLFVAYGDTYNVPVAAEVGRQAKVSCLVTNTKSARDLRAELEVSGTIDSLDLAIVACDVRDNAARRGELAFKGVNTLFELQLLPGHTIAYQSFALAGETEVFHLSTDYLWRFEADATYITGLNPQVLPVFNYRLPVTVSRVESKSSLPTFTFQYA